MSKRNGNGRVAATLEPVTTEANDEQQVQADQYEGITVDMEGDTLVIRVDTTYPGKLSTSGKNYTIATTHGFHSISRDLGLNMNITRRNPDAPRRR